MLLLSIDSSLKKFLQSFVFGIFHSCFCGLLISPLCLSSVSNIFHSSRAGKKGREKDTQIGI